MSANTYWRPKDRGTSLDVTSSFLDRLAEAQGLGGPAHEVVLTEADVPILRAMRAVDRSLTEATHELEEAIARHGMIVLWREY